MAISWLAVALFFLHQHHKLKEFTVEVSSLVEQAKKVERHKELHARMKEQAQKARTHFIQQTVETLTLLQPEKSRVAALAKQFPDNPSLKERLQFLESDQNQIQFELAMAEDGVHLKLQHRVQMDLNDLKIFLEAVDQDRYDASKGKPFFLMKKFDLLKCYEKGDEKVYSIDVELIQKQ